MVFIEKYDIEITENIEVTCRICKSIYIYNLYIYIYLILGQDRARSIQIWVYFVHSIVLKNTLSQKKKITTVSKKKS